MNILVYGAGVLGSLYAARLKEAGQNVSILARGQRLDDIREQGIVLVDALTERFCLIWRRTGQWICSLLSVILKKGRENPHSFYR